MKLGYAWAEILGRGDRSLLNILGMAVAITLFISLSAFSSAYKETAERPFKDMGVDITVQGLSDNESFVLNGNEFVLPYKTRLISDNEVEKIRSLPGVKKTSSSLVIWNFDPRRFNIITGVDDVEVGPARSLAGTTIKHYEYDLANQRFIEKENTVRSWMLSGKFFESGERGAAVVESHYAAWYGIKTGDTIDVGGKKFRVSGIVEIKEGSQLAASNIYIPLMDAQEILGTEGVNMVFIKVDDYSHTKNVMRSINEKLAGVEVSSSDSVLQLMGGIAAVADRSALIASLIALIGAGILVFKTAAENILSRTRDIGVLRAVGWTGKDVRKEILSEIMIQCMLGWVLGVLAGYVISYLLGGIKVEVPLPLAQAPAFTQAPGELMTATKLLVKINPITIMLSAMVSFLTAFLTGIVLSARLITMKPSQALVYN